jgi:hypothetical protein
VKLRTFGLEYYQPSSYVRSERQIETLYSSYNGITRFYVTAKISIF